MPGELTGKVAFVSGSGKGLGRAIAARLAALGADVALHDRRWDGPAKWGEAADLGEVAAAVAALGVRTAWVTGDIADPGAVAAMQARIAAELGDPEILVNCAGGDIGAAGGKPVPNDVLGIPLADIEALVDNNLVGTMLMCQAFVPAMVRAGRGCVINVASTAAHRGASEGAVYGTLKAAVVHYTRCLAAEVREHGVRVNALSPGPTKTARFEATRTVDPAKMSGNGRTLDRYAEAEEVADVAGFLAGLASRFVTGQVLRVDGGLTLFPG